MRGVWLVLLAGCGFETKLESSCGDGVLDPGESCDDGNLSAGDGCTAACTIEPSFVCPNGANCRAVLGVALGTTTTLARFGGSGGTPFMRDCKAGALAFDFEGWFGNQGSWIGRTRAGCATVALGATGHAITTATTPTDWAGNDSQVGSSTHACDANEVITGVSIGVDTVQGFSAATGFRIQCQQLVHLDGKLSFVALRELELHGPGGGAFTLSSCDAGSVLTGFYGSSGAVLDAVAFRCTTLSPIVCGDGMLTSGVEQCDDGNAVAGDGCNARCQTE